MVGKRKKDIVKQRHTYRERERERERERCKESQSETETKRDRNTEYLFTCSPQHTFNTIGDEKKEPMLEMLSALNTLSWTKYFLKIGGLAHENILGSVSASFLFGFFAVE